MQWRGCVKLSTVTLRPFVRTSTNAKNAGSSSSPPSARRLAPKAAPSTSPSSAWQNTNDRCQYPSTSLFPWRRTTLQAPPKSLKRNRLSTFARREIRISIARWCYTHQFRSSTNQSHCLQLFHAHRYEAFLPDSMPSRGGTVAVERRSRRARSRIVGERMAIGNRGSNLSIKDRGVPRHISNPESTHLRIQCSDNFGVRSRELIYRYGRRRRCCRDWGCCYR